MSRSILLQIARDSIEEVFQAQRSINNDALLQEYPLLHSNIKTTVNLYVNKEIKGSFTSQGVADSLLYNIIIGAKKAAFEDKTTTILTTSEYLHAEVEILLETEDGVISEIDPPILQEDVHSPQYKNPEYNTL